MKKRRWIRGPFFIIKLVLILLLTSLALMWLWNWLVPDLFHGPVVTYWQAIGVLLLSKVMFGGLGRGYRGRHRDHYPGGMWRKDFRGKLEKMTPEEREKFRRSCRGSYYGWDKNPDEEKTEETDKQSPPL